MKNRDGLGAVGLSKRIVLDNEEILIQHFIRKTGWITDGRALTLMTAKTEIKERLIYSFCPDREDSGSSVCENRTGKIKKKARIFYLFQKVCLPRKNVNYNF